MLNTAPPFFFCPKNFNTHARHLICEPLEIVSPMPAGEAKPAAKAAAQPMLVYSSKKDRGEAFKRLLDDKARPPFPL